MKSETNYEHYFGTPEKAAHMKVEIVHGVADNTCALSVFYIDVCNRYKHNQHWVKTFYGHSTLRDYTDWLCKPYDTGELSLGD